MNSYSNRIFTVTIAQSNETITKKISLNSKTQQESMDGRVGKDENIIVNVEAEERRGKNSNDSNPPHSKDTHITVNLDMSFQSDSIPDEPFKTLLSGLFLATACLVTAASLVFIHDRVPKVEPLPDIILNNIQYESWGLDVSEVLLIVNMISALLVIMMHYHRCIILRRILLILGILYYYRALTMFVTVLPKVDPHYECAPRTNDTTPIVYINRIITILSGGGLSINGKHVFCGDYIFSGHTMTFVLSHLTINQYSPRSFVLLHWTSFIVALCGVVFLLLGRGHYTIDVLLAYYVSTRLWWIYHTMAHNHNLKKRGPSNSFNNLCWWHIFTYFEGKTSGPLPHKYSFPLPNCLKRWICALLKGKVSLKGLERMDQVGGEDQEGPTIGGTRA